MSEHRQGLRSHVGTKYLVAVTGALLLLFVIVHMLGNLQIYLGPEAVNSYAELLKSTPVFLWSARLGLLAAFLIHIWGIIRLTLDNRAARPAGYSLKKSRRASLFSRTMLPSGLILLAFVVYHLLHFTIGVTHPNHFRLTDAAGRHDVYSMTVLGFQQPLVSFSYILAMGLLGMHLAHGAASVFQSMGWTRLRLMPLMEGVGKLVALIIVIGNISIPLACLLGFIQPMQERL